MRAHTLSLTPEQRHDLERVRDRDPRPYLRERAGALLKIAAGDSARHVARHGLLRPRQPETVCRWLAAYRAHGLPGLQQQPRGHRGLRAEAAATVVETLHQEPRAFGLARSRWRLADLRVACPALADYSLAGVSGVLRRLGIRRQRGRLGLQSPDPAYDDKLALLASALLLARVETDHVSLVYGDEFSLYRQPTLGPTWAVAGAEPVARLSQRSNSRWRYAGALDAVTGRVTTHAADKLGVAALCRFLRKLRAAYPGRRLFLVWDNWPVHAHPTVLALAAELRIEILWLPTYAPWTNSIEKLWRRLKQDLLHHHRLADDWTGLKAAVAAYLARFAAASPDLLRYVGLQPTAVTDPPPGLAHTGPRHSLIKL